MRLPFILNIARTSRLRQEAEARHEWEAEYHYGMLGIVQGALWGCILGVPAFLLGIYVFWS